MNGEESIPNKWWEKRWVQNVGLVGLGIICVYGLIYRDVVSRAKEAYLEGDKYLEWHRSPEKKKTYFNETFNSEKTKLDQLLKKKKISADEYKRKLDIIEFDRDFNLEESSLKYSYQWFKDTYELFSPPESKWVRMARQKTPQVLDLWKEELRQKKVPFEDYMFE